jgi:hypothetical protein
MRPQQNRRMRGRGNNNNSNNSNNNQNRRGPNPLTRSYESNGPDVKIRGSAQQIAEKYATLARDAQSSGDRVMAENYLQHAEHYNRIIAAAQAQFAQQQPQRDPRDDQDEDGDDDRDGFEPANDQQRRAVQDGSGPQPVIEGTPAEVALEQDQMPTGDQEGRRAANGNGGAHGEEDESGAPRRSRRSRRGGRSRDGADAKAEGDAVAEAPAAEGETQPILVPVQD